MLNNCESNLTSPDFSSLSDRELMSYLGAIIIFKVDDQRYFVDMEAYNSSCIVLPDGRVFQVQGWLESYPPIPVGMTEQLHVFDRSNAQGIADNMSGTLATQA